MDCQFTREDDSSNTSNWRSFIAYSAPAERSGKELTPEPSKLGSDLSDITMGEIGNQVVERISGEEEWITHSTDGINQSGNNNLRRRVGCRMGSLIGNHRNFRILESPRQGKINKRAGTDSNLLCNFNALKKIKRHHHFLIQRQQNSTKIRHKGRRNSLFRPSRFSSKDPRSVQSTSTEDSLPTCTRHREYQSRQIEPSDEADVRNDDTTEDVPTDSQDLGQEDEGRCIRSLSQPSATSVLELPPRPLCFEDECLSTELEKDGPLHVSTLEVDTEGIKEDQSRQDKERGSSDTALEKPILVPDDFKDESPDTPNSMEDNTRKLEFSRLEIISNKRRTTGMNEELMAHLNKATRTSTNKAYEGYWRKYADWCKKKDYEAEKYDITQILHYLVDNIHLQYSTLNGYRSAIASVLRVLYPQRKPIAEDTDIVQFFKAKRRQEISLPSETKLETWDANILVEYILLKMSPTEDLTLYDLQQKTILLLCLHTMWRPRSDIGRLQYRDVHWKHDDNNDIEGVTLHVREPKESQQKFIKLGLLQDQDRQELCVVQVLKLFFGKIKRL